MLDPSGAPIIGMTIRFDRLDSFWFTLMHELIHAWKHLSERDIAITDESLEDEREDDSKEMEANRLARDIFIPRSMWKRSEAFLRPSAQSILALADKMHISPAIVEGRLRREKEGYKAFGDLIGNRQVRRLFPEVKWG
jgi:HTH-type transcriptional regulator/antitoxin HigA